MSLISIFFILSFYYWVDWCAYLFIGPFSIDSLACELPELEGRREKKKRPIMLGICCHGFVIFKKEGPHLPAPGPGRGTQHTSPQAADSSAQPEDRHRGIGTVSLSRVFHCSGWCGGASLSHFEPHFPYLLNGNKDTTDLSVLFWGWTEI